MRQWRVTDACEPLGAGDDSMCDGADSDCDGRTVEGFRPVDIECGEGVCQRDGSEVCQGGVTRPVCSPGLPTGDDSTCDGLDDDCDGRVEEAFVGQRVQSGVGACVNDGVTVCRSGRIEALACRRRA